MKHAVVELDNTKNLSKVYESLNTGEVAAPNALGDPSVAVKFGENMTWRNSSNYKKTYGPAI